MAVSYKYGGKSSPMFLFGSTASPTCIKYQFRKPNGELGMLSRLNTASRPGGEGDTAMQHTFAQ